MKNLVEILELKNMITTVKNTHVHNRTQLTAQTQMMNKEERKESVNLKIGKQKLCL